MWSESDLALLNSRVLTLSLIIKNAHAKETHPHSVSFVTSEIMSVAVSKRMCCCCMCTVLVISLWSTVLLRCLQIAYTLNEVSSLVMIYKQKNKPATLLKDATAFFVFRGQFSKIQGLDALRIS